MFLFFEADIITTLILTAINCGIYGPVVLLLTGPSKVWRLVTAIGVYLVFGLGLFGLLLLLILINRSM